MGTPDKAKAAEQFKRWYAAHGAERNAQKRRDRAVSPEEMRAKARDYYAQNREVRTAYMREWSKERRAAMPQAQRFAHTADQRARRRQPDAPHLDWQNLAYGPCVHCGKDDATVSWDDVIPLGRGGQNTAANCARCCLSCNRSKNARTPKEWKDPSRAEAKRARKREYIRQWHRDHYAELYEKRRARREAVGHW